MQIVAFGSAAAVIPIIAKWIGGQGRGANEVRRRASGAKGDAAKSLRTLTQQQSRQRIGQPGCVLCGRKPFHLGHEQEELRAGQPDKAR